MMTYRKKLLIAFIFMIMLVLITLGFLLGNLFKNSFMQAFNNTVQRETEFIAHYIEIRGGLNEFLKHNKMEDLMPLLDSNVTILSDEGNILYDSNQQQITDPKSHYAVLQKITLEKGLKSETGYETVKDQQSFHYYWRTIKKSFFQCSYRQ